MELDLSIKAFQPFCGADLTATLARIESSIRGVPAARLEDALPSFGPSETTLAGSG
jgi:hypothetical protein